MKVLKLGCGIGALTLGGGLLGFLLFAWLFCVVVWGFPENWKPLRGLPDGKPQALMALDAEQDTFLLRMENGTLYSCVKQDCQPEQDDWSADFPCTAENRPALTNFIPLLLLKNFEGLLSCERSYTDIARTVVIGKVNGDVWAGGGIGLIPTDAAVVMTGLLGALTGSAVALVASLLALAVRAVASRQKSRNI